MFEDIKKILELSVNAPSGHNSQPWRFVVSGDSVFVWNIPEKDKTSFNYKQRGSLVANGALIENIAIISSTKNYEIDINLFPDKRNPDLIARIRFIKNGKFYKYGYLSSHILNRTTNRKPFKVQNLASVDEKKIRNLINSFDDSGYDVFLVKDREKIEKLSSLFSVGDRLIFENVYVHRALFDNVNWTLKEEKERREGLYVCTKELSFFDRLVLKHLLSKWNVISKLSKIGLSAKVAEKRERLYNKCSAIGLITADKDFPEDFVGSGRILQRVWLKVTYLGLSFQPVSVGLLYLGQKCVFERSPEGLTDKQIELVSSAYSKIRSIFNLSAEIPTFSFRIGYAEPPSASSLKKAPEITFK